MLQRSSQIELCYDPASVAYCYSGFAGVWKGKHHGLEVVTKVLRIYATSGLHKITRVSRRWCSLLHVFVDMLTVTCAEVLQGVRNTEGSSSFECIAAARGYNVRDPVCNLPFESPCSRAAVEGVVYDQSLAPRETFPTVRRSCKIVICLYIDCSNAKLLFIRVRLKWWIYEAPAPSAAALALW